MKSLRLWMVVAVLSLLPLSHDPAAQGRLLPGKLIVSAWRREGGSLGAGQSLAQGSEKSSEADLKKWVRQQVAALPKRPPGPPEMGTASGVDVPKELRAELAKMDGMRKGAKTALDEVDGLGKKLLETYPDPKEQGQIYYMLAHVHAQSGLVRPEKVVEYARKALDHSLEARQVPRLYVYWGDAVQIAKAREAKVPFPQRRKWSAVIYLAGLREVLRHPLPAKASEPPPFDRGLVRDPPPGKEEEGRQHLAKYEAARQLASFQRDMIQHRDVLTRQLADLYLRRSPVDHEELRHLAAGVLRDPRSLDRFMRAVKGATWGE